MVSSFKIEQSYEKSFFGIAGSAIAFLLFLASQNNFAKGYDYRKESKQDSINRAALLKLNNEVMKSIEQKVEDMEKYVNESQKYIEAGQKNLDLWLKYLAFTLSIIIGASIFNGLRSRELAKEELAEIRRIKEDIKRDANDAVDRLKFVKEQLAQIEKTAASAKEIEGTMAQSLKDIGSRTDIVLNETQKKILDDSLVKIKEDMEKGGVETFKNLYFAKALKAQNDKEWEEVIRLINSYNDLDENNEVAMQRRGFAYYQLAKQNKNKDIIAKALRDYNEVIRINPSNRFALNNRGNIYTTFLKDHEKAIADYSEIIRLNPEYALAYFNRAIAYKSSGKLAEAKVDLATAKKLDPETSDITGL